MGDQREREAIGRPDAQLESLQRELLRVREERDSARNLTAELERLANRYREALEEADRRIASALGVRDELAGDVVLELEKARAALASPPEEQNG